MSQHWPLGKGRYFASFVHSCLAASLAAFGLLLATVLVLDALKTEHDVASSCAFWAAAAFVFAGMQGALILLFRPPVLATLLPTPADEAAIYSALDPLESLPYRVVPYVLGVFATLAFQRRPTPASVACVFTVCMLFRLFLPILAVLGVRLRKLFVPWGHWLLWAAAIGTIVGLCSEWPARSNAIALSVAALCSGSFWVNLAAGVACIPLAWPVRSWARRAMRRQLRREELLELAYPLVVERAAKPRKLLLEAIGGGKRLRRFAFLAQEATGLYRPRDWGKAAVVWVTAFVPMLFIVRHESGSGVHLAVTVVPLAAVWFWGFVRLIRFERTFCLWPLGSYGLPVGHLELFAARVVILSLAYWVTGALATGVVAFVADQPTVAWGAVLAASATNLGQVWLIALAWAGFLSFSLAWRQQPSVREVAAYGAGSGSFFLLAWVVVLGCLGDPLVRVPFSGAVPWQLVLHRGVVRTVDFARPLLAAGGAASEAQDTVLAFVERNFWQVEAVIWAFLLLLAWFCLRVLVARERGRAHPKYCARPIAWQPSFGPFAGGRRR
ncbi:MAG TPA: hypothetical protein VNE39_05965 [Planctomycetota bacterium]|nr:hypothetical protein [Planctomycetota bacterium]